MLTDEDRLDYLKEAETLLATLPMPAQRELYAARVADRAGVRREGVLQDVENLRKRRMKSAKKQEIRDNQPMKTVQPANREINARACWVSSLCGLVNQCQHFVILLSAVLVPGFVEWTPTDN